MAMRPQSVSNTGTLVPTATGGVTSNSDQYGNTLS